MTGLDDVAREPLAPDVPGEMVEAVLGEELFRLSEDVQMVRPDQPHPP